MSATTPAEVEQLLGDGSEAQLIGQPEDDWLDFKEQPYVLTTEKQRWELAKDVANMASNPEGGCIAIGFETKQDSDDFEEVADKGQALPVSPHKRSAVPRRSRFICLSAHPRA